MPPVFLGLLAAGLVGGWVAWRRHPLYSTRLTLRTAAFTASALAAVIGAIVASAKLTFDQTSSILRFALSQYSGVAQSYFSSREITLRHALGD